MAGWGGAGWRGGPPPAPARVSRWAPAQKYGPPVTTAAPTAGLRSISSQTATRAAAMAGVRALRRAGGGRGVEGAGAAAGRPVSPPTSAAQFWGPGGGGGLPQRTTGGGEVVGAAVG